MTSLAGSGAQGYLDANLDTARFSCPNGLTKAMWLSGSEGPRTRRIIGAHVPLGALGGDDPEFEQLNNSP